MSETCDERFLSILNEAKAIFDQKSKGRSLFFSLDIV